MNENNQNNQMSEEEKRKREMYLLNEYQTEHSFLSSQAVGARAYIRQLESELEEAKRIIASYENAQTKEEKDIS